MTHSVVQVSSGHVRVFETPGDAPHSSILLWLRLSAPNRSANSKKGPSTCCYLLLGTPLIFCGGGPMIDTLLD